MLKLFEAGFEISFAMLPVIILLLVLTPILGKRYPAKVRYFVWLAIAVRLLIPINTSLRSILQSLFPTANILYQVDENAVMETIRAALSMSIEGTAGINYQTGHMGLSLMSVIAVLWIIGFVVFMVYHMIAYHITYRHLHRWSIAVYDRRLLKSFDEKKAALSIRRKIKLYHNEKISTPMLIGFLSPCILIPYTHGKAAEYNDILLHELHHFKRRDLWYKLLMLFANGVQWFNPLVYLMLRQAEIDMELACDYDVLLDANSAVRKQYGLTILAFIKQKKAVYSPLATGFYGNQEQMMRRFSDITYSSKKKSGKGFLCAIILTAIFCCTWMGNASSAMAADNNMLWPVPNYSVVTSLYGMRFNGADFHNGIDISGEDIKGAPVIAANSGTVVYVNPTDNPVTANGICVVVDHGGGVSTVYSHLSEVSVNTGETVKKGQQIANVGATGFVNGPQMQFEVREDGKPVDPISYLVPVE